MDTGITTQLPKGTTNELATRQAELELATQIVLAQSFAFLMQEFLSEKDGHDDTRVALMENLESVLELWQMKSQGMVN